MRRALVCAIAAAAAAALLTTGADARFLDHRLEAPNLIKEAACVVRRVRTVRSNGRVVYRTVQRCDRDSGRGKSSGAEPRT